MSHRRSARALMRAAASRVAQSLVRRAARDIRARQLFTEALETRQLLSSSLISGGQLANGGTSYTLNLNAVEQESGSQWAINWGDGSPVQNVATTLPNVQHTFPVGPANYTVTAGFTNGLANPLDRSFGGDGDGNGGGKSTVATPGVDDEGFDVVVQPDGKLLVAGSAGLTVARFNANGTPDLSFGTNGRASAAPTGEAHGIVLLDDGKILVGGGANFALARFNSDGSLDTTFGSGGTVSSGFGTSYFGRGIAVVAGGKIVEVGWNSDNFVAARFNANGSVDTSFGTNGKANLDFFGKLDKAFALAVQEDGKLVLAGQARQSAVANYDFALARYNADGTIDNTFGTNGKVTTDLGHVDDVAFDVKFQSDGKIVAVGRSGTASTGYDFAAARYTTSGALDTSFGSGGSTKVHFGYDGDTCFTLAVLPDDKLLLGGQTQSNRSAMNFGVARLNADGTLDTTFGNGGKVGTDFVSSSDRDNSIALLDGDAFVMIGGRSTVGANGEMDYALAKYHLDTSASLLVAVDGGASAGTRVQTAVTFGREARNAVPGYFNDYGQGYEQRRSGETFGWVTGPGGTPISNVGAGFYGGGSQDKRRVEGIVSGGKAWEMHVPNGDYRVKLVAGNAGVTSGTYGYDIEGNSFLRGTVTGTGNERWITAEDVVHVTDHELTITLAPGMTNDALAYLEIIDKVARDDPIVASPGDVRATSAGDNVTDVRWTDRSDNETGFLIERAPAAGGPWTTLTTVNPVNANAGFYADASGQNGATYVYRVTALQGVTGTRSVYGQSNSLTTPTFDHRHDRAPYNAARAAWNGANTIQAEDYDASGNTPAYDDTTDGNAGGYYRSGNGDIGFNKSDGHYFVGWTKVGEYNEYTVNVPEAGDYTLQMSVASDGMGGTFQALIDGVVVVQALQVGNTTSFNHYETRESGSFHVNQAGVVQLRVLATADNASHDWVGDVDWIKLKKIVQPRVRVTATPASVFENSTTPIKVRVEVLNPEALTGAITVSLDAPTGTATRGTGGPGTDFTSSDLPTGASTVVLSSAATFREFTITPSVDTDNESDETVIVSLTPDSGSGYEIADGGAGATAVIKNYDGTNGGSVTAVLAGPSVVDEGSSASVTLSNVSAGPNRVFRFSFGDDDFTNDADTTNPVATVPASLLDDDGIVTAYARVSDSTGQYVTSVQIAVANVAPTVQINGVPSTTTAGVPVTLQGSFTDPSQSDTAGMQFAWTIKDQNGQTISPDANSGGQPDRVLHSLPQATGSTPPPSKLTMVTEV